MTTRRKEASMRIHDILTHKSPDVWTIPSDRTVRDAIREMNSRKVGCLVVTDSGREIRGIITERDVLRMCGERCAELEASARHEEGCPARVADVMTKEVLLAVPEDTVDYAMGVMTQNRVRHLPVVDDGLLVGLVSIGDLVRESLGETEYENRLLKDYIRGVPVF
ncbi:MAG: CBS domain-containing protein [Gemmatimonadota bacterium]